MKLLFILLLFFISCDCTSQTIYQEIRGIVIDNVNRMPLDGATVSCNNSTAITDSGGHFVLPNLPVGRIQIQCSYIGYEKYVSDNIILSAGKQTDLVIEMEEDGDRAQHVLVTSSRFPRLPVNKYALISGRSFSPEETQRYAASANDPSRMALAFAGVQATRDTRSDIIIRGNNPVGMQWRLEGVDIPNPNHFARKGSSGGGITIFSLSMLANSDFLTGAMPAEYGDALSGVFDMHLRKGNNQRTESTIKAGMIGLDFATEGPIKKGRSSYLANYRYSTLGLLQSIGLNLVGERESNTFQDLSFNLAFANKNNKVQWNVWGIGGISKETLPAVKDTNDWKQYDDYAVYDFTTKMGAIGIGNTITINDQSYVANALVATGQQINFVDDTLNRKRQPYTINNERYLNGRISFASSYTHKFSASSNLKTGVYINYINFDLRQDKFDYIFQRYKNFINGAGNTMLWQPYLQMSYKPVKYITINPGVHVMHLSLNGKTTVDPRISIQYKATPSQTYTLAYGLHSKIVPLGSYFYRSFSNNSYPNLNLDMMRSHHLVIAYDQLLTKVWRLHIEAYYQRLFQIPVDNEVNSTFWLLNELEGYAQQPLVSKGKGTNMGMDFSVEKTFDKGWFMITSFSVFNSTYMPLNGKEYNTRFNSNTNGSWTGAKEWKMKNNKVFQWGWKAVYNGGLPITPLLPAQFTSREPLLDEDRPYSQRVPAYGRVDTRFALRKDKQKRTWQLALDVQNILGIRNTDALNRRYDPSINKWIVRKQSGIVPVLSYQYDF
jgi:hypothetical protein